MENLSGKTPSPGAIASNTAKADVIAVAVLLITSIVTAWPILRDGHATYMDNPAHLAEIHSLAFDAVDGWSGLAYCGYPLGSMHSPLWYGLLSLVARMGLPVTLFYAFLVWLGFIAPPLVLFNVTRRHVPVFAAAILAYLFMLPRSVLFGFGSPMAGMWTSYLGAAGVILLVDRITRPCESRRDFAQLAAIVALSALTHLYTLYPMVFLGAFHSVRLLVRRQPELRRLTLEAAAGVLGALVALVYWVQPFLVRSHAEITPHDQPIGALLARLLLPVNLIAARNLPAPRLSWWIDAAPMVLIVVVGLVGIGWLHRRRSELPLYGFAMLVTFTALLVWAWLDDLSILGNYSWRMLYYVRVGLVLTALPLVAFLAQRCRPPKLLVILAAALAMLSGLWFSRPLRAVVLPIKSAEVAMVLPVWDWLRDNHQPTWGRLYVQGTFGSTIAPLRLRQSHLLALTAQQTGVEQVGAFYGGMPIRTTNWTLSEFGRVFGVAPTDAAQAAEVLAFARFANVTHFLLSDPRFTETLQANGCDVLFTSGPFAVLEIRGSRSNWILSAIPGVSVARRRTGHAEIVTSETFPGGTFVVKEAFHPFWVLEGPPDCSVRADEFSRLLKVSAGAGAQRLVLRYAPPRWPRTASLVGLLGLLALTFWRSMRSFRRE